MKEGAKKVIIVIEVVILILAAIFVATLVIDGIEATEEEKEEESNLAPTVTIECDMTNGKIPLEISFESNVLDDGTIESYNWNFGDGRTSTSENCKHTFEAEGNFLVTLIVTDSYGEIGQDSIIIEVKDNQPPVADASYDIPSYWYMWGPPTLIEFIGEGQDPDGEIVSYHWEFGPKYYPIVPYKGYFFHNKEHWYDYLISVYESDEQNPMMVLSREGYYWAELTVTDDDGATDTDKIFISVWDFGSLLKQSIRESFLPNS